ncbi:MAG: CDP-diacylglycerol--glycerol-3-phosphate 3-phosphatidyltransferase [Ruminococcaceae bacterium]|nr:CDP-diacylglycerol--glycerol-3-phosphate 3-phosphatidyltransferase [Oscillospiraceae bacterium]
MNTPNKLTLGRMIATPIFMATMLIDFPYHYAVSLVLFALASLTDMIDGKMARKYNLVTDFGKFLDPLADKMLTTSAYLGFMFLYSAKTGSYGWQMTTIVFIVLFREFMVSSLRLVTAKAGLVVAANIWGKLKTVSQMVGLVVALFAYTLISDFGLSQIEGVCDIIIMVLFWISAVLCVISGLIYLNECKGYINTSK